ncbi:UNVERIFIED_CONTAM: hypothetical protein Sangu_2709800, partial [Sesamum angustifolium]
ARRIHKCYINMYEDLWEELCTLFAAPIDEDEPSAKEPDLVVLEGNPDDIKGVV